MGYTSDKIVEVAKKQFPDDFSKIPPVGQMLFLPQRYSEPKITSAMKMRVGIVSRPNRKEVVKAVIVDNDKVEFYGDTFKISRKDLKNHNITELLFPFCLLHSKGAVQKDVLECCIAYYFLVAGHMTSYNVKEGSQFSLKGFRAACKVIAEGDLPDSEANVPELVTSLRKRELELVGSEDVQSGHGHDSKRRATDPNANARALHELIADNADIKNTQYDNLCRLTACALEHLPQSDEATLLRTAYDAQYCSTHEAMTTALLDRTVLTKKVSTLTKELKNYKEGYVDEKLKGEQANLLNEGKVNQLRKELEVQRRRADAAELELMMYKD